MDIKVMVATHKKYWMPDDKVYLPIQLGAAIHEDLHIAKDSTGDNISVKQPYYSELTAIYWAWKNLKADYIGINHYRRYFSKEKFNIFGNGDKSKIYTYDDFAKVLKNHPVILPTQRNYYIESRYAQYKNAHNLRDLIRCRSIIRKLYPDYVDTFNKCLKSRKGHILNMFVMRYDIYCRYCKWLFNILFSLEKVISIDGYSTYQQRVFGYIAERLLDVWIEYNQIKYIDINYVMLEKMHIPLKIVRFIRKTI